MTSADLRLTFGSRTPFSRSAQPMEESWFPAGQWTGQKAGSRTTPEPPLDAITADDSEGPEEAAAAAEKQADGAIKFFVGNNS